MTRLAMLSRFFVHDGGETQKWRLKGHAEGQFIAWLKQWSVIVDNPARYGFTQKSYDLPELKTEIAWLTTGARDGQLFSDIGFIYHSRVTIWKNPVTEMQRTKALGLLHKQTKKDSTMSRVGIPDYVLVFRKDGEPTSCTSGNAWNLDDALMGSTAGSDRFNGTRSARFNSTNANINASTCNTAGGMCIEMSANVAGAQQVRWYCAKYGTDTTDGVVQLQSSTDGGTNWNNEGATVTCTGATLTQYSRSVSFSSTAVRFRFVKTNSVSTSRTNIDDVEILN